MFRKLTPTHIPDHNRC